MTADTKGKLVVILGKNALHSGFFEICSSSISIRQICVSEFSVRGLGPLLESAKDMTQALIQSGAHRRQWHVEVLDKGTHLSIHVDDAFEVEAAAGKAGYAKGLLSICRVM